METLSLPVRPRRCCVLVVIVAFVIPGAALPTVALGHDVSAEMAEAADRFLSSLSDAQRGRVLLDFGGDKRTLWHFFPSTMLESQGGRPGLPIKEMSPGQRLLAHGLLSTALSHHGYRQSLSVMMLESILRDLENGSPARDAELYHVAVFGKPSTDKTWAWRFEGHHLSVKLTLVDGRRFGVTPSFFGSNPAKVKKGRLEGVEVLAVEQQLARRLVRSLAPDQRTSAIMADEAPRDIITGADRKVEKGRFQPPKGISFEKLNEKQRKMLLALVSEFAGKYRPQIVAQIDGRKPFTDGRGTFFAWAGGTEPGQGHYYRVQTPGFLFEYDNTQGNANHIHTVWREFDGDFGEDLLRAHYETSSHHRRGGVDGEGRSIPRRRGARASR